MALSKICRIAIEHIRQMATDHLEGEVFEELLSRLSEMEKDDQSSKIDSLAILHYFVALLMNPFGDPTRNFLEGCLELEIQRNIRYALLDEDKEQPLRLFAEAYFLSVMRERDDLSALLSHFDECSCIPEGANVFEETWLRIAYAIWMDPEFSGYVRTATEALLKLYRRKEHAWASHRLLRWIAEATAFADRDRLEEIASDVRGRQEEGRSENWISRYLQERYGENRHSLLAERLATAMEEALASDPSLSYEDAGWIAGEMCRGAVSFKEARNRHALFRHLKSAADMTEWGDEIALAFALFSAREGSLPKGLAFAAEFAETRKKFPEETFSRIWNRTKLYQEGVPEENQEETLDQFEVLFHAGMPTLHAWRQALEKFGVSSE